MRRACWGLWWLALWVIAAGCLGEPKCRERVSNQEAMAKWLERVEESLDDADVSEDRIKVVVAKYKALAPLNAKTRDARDAEWASMVTQLKRDKPERAALRKHIKVISALTTRYSHKIVDVSLSVHAALKPSERQAIASAWSKEKRKPVSDSFLVRQAIASKMRDWKATTSQREMVDTIKMRLIGAINRLGFKLDKVKKETLALITASKPDPAKAHRTVDRASVLMTALAYQGVDLFLMLHATMSRTQKQLVRRDMVALEICKADRP